ncbi:unnamed protein product, partial [Leptidea sinapis]
VETPVRFRTSPPLEALKPRRAGGVCAGGAGVCGAGAGGGGGPSPPSPRRRRMPLPPPRRHRPALDFDKMQQSSRGTLNQYNKGEVPRLLVYRSYSLYSRAPVGPQVVHWPAIAARLLRYTVSYIFLLL